MLTAKPHPAGKPAELDGSDKMTEVQDLASLPGAELIPAQDFGQFGNPDAAAGGLSAVPGCMEGAPQGAMRSQNVSGGGSLQKTAQTSAPKSNPIPRP
jgi:hypothetical protein